MPDYQPIWVYAIQYDGRLRWYRKDSITSNWYEPKVFSISWQHTLDVFPAGGNRFFSVEANGDLYWFEHHGFNDGRDDILGPFRVDTGWNQFSKRFSGNDGLIYAIQPDGTLLWYRYKNFRHGQLGDTLDSPKVVGSGWSQFRQVFSQGQGVIYAVEADGTLLWYLHKGFEDGSNSWTGPKIVGSAWEQFSTILPVGWGVILAIKSDGSMLRYKHVNYLEGVSLTGRGVTAQMSALWEGPLEIGSGFFGFHQIFALLPESTSDGP